MPSLSALGPCRAVTMAESQQAGRPHGLVASAAVAAIARAAAELGATPWGVVEAAEAAAEALAAVERPAESHGRLAPGPWFQPMLIPCTQSMQSTCSGSEDSGLGSELNDAVENVVEVPQFQKAQEDARQVNVAFPQEVVTQVSASLVQTVEKVVDVPLGP